MNTTEALFEKKKSIFQEINCKTPLKFFWYFKYSKKTVAILIYLNLQFLFSIFLPNVFFKTQKIKFHYNKYEREKNYHVTFKGVFAC